MSLTLRHQLTALDRALMNLLNERARLLTDFARGGVPPPPAIEDLLARSSGEFPAKELREVFEAVDLGARAAHGVQSVQGGQR